MVRLVVDGEEFTITVDLVGSNDSLELLPYLLDKLVLPFLQALLIHLLGFEHVVYFLRQVDDAQQLREFLVAV